ncbi:hypothetical protein CALCODRAFT_272465 [Calocera cornea HHB12733]|uniref:BTB domain-containing protein n=1 Tax=Calocera cornea HHB12733 TaxID=1353952 RepID=A0A165G6I4_9BASI|nr:hypothetical protein CALCODRAFT_272465 [Calocera cornea HHB12733]
MAATATASASHPRTPRPTTPLPAFLLSTDADTVLLSSDRPAVQLRVHRRILLEASEFFRTMFGLPQPSVSGGGGSGGKVRARGKGRGKGKERVEGAHPALRDGCVDAEEEEEEEEDLPRIDMPEPSSVLIPLLTLLYPVPAPALLLPQLPALLRAAHKYDLPSALAHLRGALLTPSFLESDPLAVYALACEFGLRDEARAASRCTLKVELMALLLPLPDKLGGMLAVDLVQLVALRVARASQAKALIKAPSALQGLRCSCGHLPPWVAEWRRRACQELDRFPVAETVFGSGFLGDCVGAVGAVGCAKCGAAGWDRAEWERLRQEVDALPDTI